MAREGRRHGLRVPSVIQELIQGARLKSVLCPFGDTADETDTVSHQRFRDLAVRQGRLACGSPLMGMVILVALAAKIG